MTARQTKIVTKKRPKQSGLSFKLLMFGLAFLIMVFGLLAWHIQSQNQSKADNDLSSFRATPFNKVRPLARPSIVTGGVSPVKIKSVYNLGSSGGSGVVAIIDAYADSKIESDLGTFTRQFGLRSCTIKNGCFEKHQMTSRLAASPDWAIETALDVQWAHAIAPDAKILLVQARSNSGTDLLDAIDYARGRSDVRAISMSWGGDEFSSEGFFETHFTSSFGATFFASSGDGGHGISWPAVSANVIGVGGTSLHFDSSGHFTSETAWSGSGGGVSSYINEPSFQSDFGLSSTGGKRAVPDVAYDGDPSSGFPVYDSISYFGSRGWFVVGGTSAGAPQWAALRSISSNVTQSRLYQDAHNQPGTFLRDIVSGSNGSCGTLCHAQTSYDFVTGLGSPLGSTF